MFGRKIFTASCCHDKYFFMELLDKCGHDDAGFRKAMAELGLGKIYEDLDRLEAEKKAHPEIEVESCFCLLEMRIFITPA